MKKNIYVVRYIEIGMESPATAWFLKYENAKKFESKCERSNGIGRIYDYIDYNDSAFYGNPNAGFPASLLMDNEIENNYYE